MKIYLCVAAIFAGLVLANCEPGSMTDGQKEAERVMEECARETGVTLEEPLKPLSLDDRKLKCFYACTMKRERTLIDGKVSAEKAIEMFNIGTPGGLSDSKKAVLTKCANKANEEKDECEVVGTLQKCLMKNQL